MNNQQENQLREIGALLDRHQFPRIYNGGLVLPGETAVPPLTPGKETDNVGARKRRSAAGSRKRPPRRERQAHGPRSSVAKSPLVCAGFKEQYETELDAVRDAYPGAKIWRTAGGLWLLTESTILKGLGKKATILTALPFSPSVRVRGWGFWTSIISTVQIGPRHCNFDGSICAFERDDMTWIAGDSVVLLLDLYTSWASRHLYLEQFGRWPGYQSVIYPFERRTELSDDDFCGCENSEKLYADCCKEADLARDAATDAAEFYKNFGLTRKPPEYVCKIIKNGGSPPPITTLGP